jgi:outer membrane autotransporter protein
MKRYGVSKRLKMLVLLQLLTAVPFAFSEPQAEASYLNPSSEVVKIGGEYRLGNDSFANLDGAGQDGKTIAAEATSDVTVLEGHPRNYTIGMAHGAKNNTIRLDMQGHNFSISGNYVIIGILDERNQTKNNVIQIQNANHINLHTGHAGTNKIMNSGYDGELVLEGNSLTLSSKDSQPNYFPGFVTNRGSISRVDIKGDITVDVNSIGVAVNQKADALFESRDGSITVNAAASAVKARTEGQQRFKAAKNIKLWTWDTAPSSPTFMNKDVVYASGSALVEMNAGADVDVVNTIHYDGTAVIHNDGGTITSESGGTTTITGEMGSGILSDKGTIELTAARGIRIGGDALDGHGNAVHGALETGIDATGGTVTLHSDATVLGSKAVQSTGGTVTFEKGAILTGTEGALMVSNGGLLSAMDTGTAKQVTGPVQSEGDGSKAEAVFATDDSYLNGDAAAKDKGTVDLTFAGGAVWNGKASAYEGTEAGTLQVSLNDEALWNMAASSHITLLSGEGGTVRFRNGGDALEADTVTGSHTYAMDLDYRNHDASDMLYAVNGTSDKQKLHIKNISALNHQMKEGDAVRFATVRNAGGGFQEGTRYYASNGVYNDALIVNYRKISEDPAAAENYDGGNKPSEDTAADLYGGEEGTNIYLVKKEKVEIDQGAHTPKKAADIVWRYVNDLDTFTNRTGETQYFTSGADQGGWLRFKYRNLGIDGAGEVDGNTYELGYTAVVRQDAEYKHRFGAALAYGKETGRFEGYGGDLEVRDMTAALYDTQEFYPAAETMARKPAWKQGTHSYWDNYLKFHHVRTQYSAVDRHSEMRYDGKYSQNVVNLSTEYGRENKLDESWSWVPQTQLQFSYVGGYAYEDSEGIHVSADHSWSLVGRLGFDLVKHLDPRQDSKLYVKASLLHEFLEGYDICSRSFSSEGYDSGIYRSEESQKGTWGAIGLGCSIKSGKEQYLYLDAERYIGHDFSRTYNVRAGINWRF